MRTISIYKGVTPTTTTEQIIDMVDNRLCLGRVASKDNECVAHYSEADAHFYVKVGSAIKRTLGRREAAEWLVRGWIAI